VPLLATYTKDNARRCCLGYIAKIHSFLKGTLIRQINIKTLSKPGDLPALHNEQKPGHKIKLK